MSGLMSRCSYDELMRNGAAFSQMINKSVLFCCAMCLLVFVALVFNVFVCLGSDTSKNTRRASTMIATPSTKVCRCSFERLFRFPLSQTLVCRCLTVVVGSTTSTTSAAATTTTTPNNKVLPNRVFVVVIAPAIHKFRVFLARVDVDVVSASW